MKSNVAFVYYPIKYYGEIFDLARERRWSKDMVTVYKRRGAVKIVSRLMRRRAHIVGAVLKKIISLQMAEAAKALDIAASTYVVPGVTNEDLKRPLPDKIMNQVKEVKRKPFDFRSKPNNEPYVFNSGYSR